MIWGGAGITLLPQSLGPCLVLFSAPLPAQRVVSVFLTEKDNLNVSRVSRCVRLLILRG